MGNVTIEKPPERGEHRQDGEHAGDDAGGDHPAWLLATIWTGSSPKSG